MGVLAGPPPKTASGALAAAQELTDTGRGRGKVGKGLGAPQPHPQHLVGCNRASPALLPPPSPPKVKVLSVPHLRPSQDAGARGHGQKNGWH